MKKNERIDVEVARQNFRFLLAFIDNPKCLKLQKTDSKQFSTKGSWLPRLSFRQWAAQPERLYSSLQQYLDQKPTFCDHLPDKEGEIYRHVALSFMKRTIFADAVIQHKSQHKIIEFCCQPDREGHTSAFSLQKARYRAAIASYALNPKEPASSAFLVLHRWDRIRTHLISIEYELNHLHEIINQPPAAHSYYYQKTCRWSCPHHDNCLTQAQEDGQPQAWDEKLTLLSGTHNLWELKELLASDGAHLEPFKTLARTYARAKEEKE